MAFTRRLFSQANRAAAYSFITTPIFYVNAAPHIGHLYTAVLGDAAHRWSQLVGATPTHFTTGTDEHGLKIQKVSKSARVDAKSLPSIKGCDTSGNLIRQAAEAAGVTPQQLCDCVSGKFKRLFDKAEVGYTDYVRTTEERHIETVHKFWNILREGGHIYKGRYEGWYSVPDEAFLSPSQVTDGTEPGTKVSMETGHTVEWFSEESYMFRLPLFRDRLLDWINSQPYPVLPESSRERVRHWLLHETNSDLSVSRPRSRLHWGVPVPNDSSQTIYVWLDALVNYLTVSFTPSQVSHNSQISHHQDDAEVCGSLWPATNQIVGKDILKFHAVYWPAFLIAAGLPLPRRIVSHAHWTIGKSKMSKSKGNVIDPHSILSKYGVEPLRYFLLRESSIQHDGDYSEERLVATTNADLPNTLGNLLQRISTPRLNPGGTRLQFHPQLFPTFEGSNFHRSPEARASEEDLALIRGLQDLPDIVMKHYDSFDFNKGITAVMQICHQANLLIDRHAPWKLVPVPDQHPWLQSILSVTIETLRLSSILLYPVIPTSVREILLRIGFEQDLNLKSDTSLQCLLTSGEGVKRFNETNCLSFGCLPVFTRLKS